jgi:hypothetical protein
MSSRGAPILPLRHPLLPLGQSTSWYHANLVTPLDSDGTERDDPVPTRYCHSESLDHDLGKPPQMADMV